MKIEIPRWTPAWLAGILGPLLGGTFRAVIECAVCGECIDCEPEQTLEHRCNSHYRAKHPEKPE